MIKELVQAGMCVRGVLQAVEMGKGAKDNWEEFDHRLKQADLDASVFKSVLQRVKDFHQVLMPPCPAPGPLQWYIF